MEEYLRLLMEQIRCKKAQPYIREEIQGHIQDQIEDNMLVGMSKEEAERAAVEDMGSPVEAGIALDRIHRPQVAWGMVVLMGIISVVSIVFHLILSCQIADYPLVSSQIELLGMGSLEFVKYTIIGFGLMLLVYRIDYSMIARYADILLIGIMIISVLMSLYFRENQHELRYEIVFPLMLLYVPLYGAVIYKYHGQGYCALWKAALWMIMPIMIAYWIPSLSLMLMLLVSMMVVFTVAIFLKWFKVSRKVVIPVLWVGLFGMPILGLVLMYFSGLLHDYQKARIKYYLMGNVESNYLNQILNARLDDIELLGASGLEWIGHIPEFNSRYIFSYLISSYGLLCGVAVAGLLAILIYKVFAITFRQKNQLGMCMGCGCGMILLYNFGIHLGENFGFLPVSQNFLPFFSTGGSSIIVCYIMMGIILSIYRYKNIYPKHIDTRRVSIKLTLNL